MSVMGNPIKVAPMSPTIGAEVSGIELAQPPRTEIIEEIRRLLLKHRVLVFRRQSLTPEQHLGFAKAFGELEVHPVYKHHPDHPELMLLQANEETPGRENIFHSDTTFRDRPAMGSILRCVSCPDVGGDTIWCDMVLAYSRLPDDIKELIGEMTAVHDILPSFAGRISPERRDAIRKQFPPVEHPIVRSHPETGEKILFVNQCFTTHISSYNEAFPNSVGRERKLDCDNLLAYLVRQAEIPEHQVRIRWEPDTVVFWDNRSTQHYAVQDYFPARRTMVRATIVGDRPS